MPVIDTPCSFLHCDGEYTRLKLKRANAQITVTVLWTAPQLFHQFCAFL